MLPYFIFIIICIVIVVINLVLLYKASFIKDSVLDRFSNKIRFIPGMFVTLSAILTYNIFLLTFKQHGREMTFKMVDRGWIDLNKEINDKYDKCPTFVNSMFGKPPNPNVTDNWVSVYYLSNLIFQAVEDFLTSIEVDESDQSAWINIFMQLFSSQLLYEQWKHSSHYYAVTTKQLGDLIFKHSLKLKTNNIRDIQKATSILLTSDEFKQILVKRHTS